MKKKIIIAVAVIVILAAGGTFYLNHKINSAVKDGKIIKGVSCEGISIGGMTRYIFGDNLDWDKTDKKGWKEGRMNYSQKSNKKNIGR